MARIHIKNYKLLDLNFSNYPNKKYNLKLHQIFLTTEIFPISWGRLDKGGLDKGGLDKGFYCIQISFTLANHKKWKYITESYCRNVIVKFWWFNKNKFSHYQLRRFKSSYIVCSLFGTVLMATPHPELK